MPCSNRDDAIVVGDRMLADHTITANYGAEVRSDAAFNRIHIHYCFDNDFAAVMGNYEAFDIAFIVRRNCILSLLDSIFLKLTKPASSHSKLTRFAGNRF